MLKGVMMLAHNIQEESGGFVILRLAVVKRGKEKVNPGKDNCAICDKP